MPSGPAVFAARSPTSGADLTTADGGPSPVHERASVSPVVSFDVDENFLHFHRQPRIRPMVNRVES